MEKNSKKDPFYTEIKNGVKKTRRKLSMISRSSSSLQTISYISFDSRVARKIVYKKRMKCFTILDIHRSKYNLIIYIYISKSILGMQENVLMRRNKWRGK